MSLAAIGFFAYVRLPYTLKFVWSPLLDRYTPPFLGRRRGWLVITQVALILGLLGISLCDPKISAAPIALISFFIVFASATQDIGIDAYRREILPEKVFGLGNSLAITGFRFGMLLASAGAFILADHLSWPTVYQIMAGCMAIGLITTLLSPEPKVEHPAPRSLSEAIVEPFKDFFQRKDALWLLAFIFLYKFGDNVASAFTTLFYLDLGFSKTEIGTISKLFGIWATIAGGLIGGTSMIYLGVRRSLWVFGILQAAANLCYAWLAYAAPSFPATGKLTALASTIVIENLTYGMGTAALVTFMAQLTNKRYTATQYALLSSLMGLSGVIIPGPAGWLKDQWGLNWVQYFLIAATLAIPGMLILFRVGRWAEPAPKRSSV